MKLSIHSTIQEIYENEQGRALLETYMPKLTRTPWFRMTYAMRFETVSRFHPWKLTRERLAQVAEELETIEY